MNILRSFLFIPADSERKLSKADATQADALILDLEDSVALANKPAARRLAAQFLRDWPREKRRWQLWVRINPLDSGLALEDLTSVVGGVPDGVMLPKAHGPEEVERLSHYLDAFEAQVSIPAESIRILPVATETPLAPFRLGSYAQFGLKRLLGLTWGPEDLAAAIGASSNVDASGDWSLTYRLVRSLTLLAAHAAGVQAVDTLFIDFRDENGLRASSRASRAEGFTGRLAIHPAQVDAINECYMPSQQEIEHAQRVVAAFASAAGAGTISLEGKMLDIPHLKQAQRVLVQSASRS